MEGLDAVLRATAEQGLEGVVAKRLDSTWVESKRTDAWVKHKDAAEGLRRLRLGAG
jgi:bifunctional non-homologous end joining protein LigD